MPVETETDVEQLTSVEDGNGDRAPPANENQQERIAESLENQDGLTQIEFTTDGTDAEQLPSRDVPKGVETLVEWRETNSGNVYVGDATTQKAALTQVGDGRTFRVTDTSAIYVRTPTAGDGVVVTFEDTA